MVAQVLQQAATVTPGADGSYEMFDYVIALREGIMDAWGGIIGAMKSSGKSMHPLTAKFALTDAFANLVTTAAILQPYVPTIFELLNSIANDTNRSEALMRSSMGVIG